ncbi:HK97 family phage prohead protease [Singulisphaera sp. PoT]|uniref:HK97 family phage prohead protease n=1 Tax=Singulisphaera sp. PoT TaxID=3411797 RepID=UPI003BF5FD79
MSQIKKAPQGSNELRIITTSLKVERRSDSNAPPKIVGHASVFDQWTTLYSGQYWVWREIVRPGAFRNALAENQDVVALFNHDYNLILGRSSAGTLLLKEDSVGLYCEIDPPDTQLGRDLAVSIERGDIPGMSFGFRVRPNGDATTIRIQGNQEIEERELLDLDLFDVSPVVSPAYPTTDVSMRSRIDLRDRPHFDQRRARAHVRLRLAEAAD